MKPAAFLRAISILSATAASTSSASFSFSAITLESLSSSSLVLLKASWASVKLVLTDSSLALSKSSSLWASVSKSLCSASQSARIRAFVLSCSSELAEIAERITSSSRLSPSTYFQTILRNSFKSSFATESEQRHSASILCTISSTGIAPRKSLKLLYSARVYPLVL